MNHTRTALFDIWKGLAIVMVCITHFSWEKGERLSLLFPFWVSMAVPIFMVIMGYLTTASWERKNYHLKNLYSVSTLKAKLIQYLRPFSVFFAAELLLEFTLNRSTISMAEAASAFLHGGIGKYGTYYVPVLLQMLVLFPVCYALLKKSSHNILLLFFFNFFYEAEKDSLGIGKDDYRILAFRYVFLISMGCWLYFQKGKFSRIQQLIMLFAGSVYIYGISYTSYAPAVFTRWNTTSMITAFYVVPIIAFSLQYCRKLRVPVLEQLGHASYFIFLFQMLYYNYLRFYLPSPSRIFSLVSGVLISLIGGYCFYRADAFLCAAAWKSRHAMPKMPAKKTLSSAAQPL